MQYIIIGYIIDGLIFGFITRYVAHSKGYDGGFLWGFFLGIIGLLVVGFRPNIQVQDTPAPLGYNSAATSAASSGGKPSNPPETPRKWECRCGASNPSHVDYCLACQTSRREGEVTNIKCPHCDAYNLSTREKCWYCGESLEEAVRQSKASKPVESDAGKMEESLNQSADSNTNVELLQKLAALHDQGILTDEEFAQKKAGILAKL